MWPVVSAAGATVKHRTPAGPLRQLAYAKIAKLDGRALRFQAQIAPARFAAGSAGDLFAVDPQSYLAVDGADIVVVPNADAPAEILLLQAALAVGRDGRKRRHSRAADRKHVAVG
jgi:hypothetical protein